MKYREYNNQDSANNLDPQKVKFAEKIDDFLNEHLNVNIAAAIYQPAKNQKRLYANAGGVQTSPAFSAFADELVSFYREYRELLITYFKINWIDQDIDIVTNLNINHQHDKHSNYDVPTLSRTERQTFKPVAMHLASLAKQLDNFELS